MTRVGFVRNDRCLELKKLVDLIELSPDPDCMMFIKDMLAEGRKQGIGMRHNLTQLEVVGEVYAQFHIACHQKEWKVQDPIVQNKKAEKHKIFFGLRFIKKPEETTPPEQTERLAEPETGQTPINTYLPRRSTESKDIQESGFIDALAVQLESMLLPWLRNLIREDLMKRNKVG